VSAAGLTISYLYPVVFKKKFNSLPQRLPGSQVFKKVFGVRGDLVRG
jgi:hypothetical protein